MELTFDWVSIKREEIQNKPWKSPKNENFWALIYFGVDKSKAETLVMVPFYKHKDVIFQILKEN